MAYDVKTDAGNLNGVASSTVCIFASAGLLADLNAFRGWRYIKTTGEIYSASAEQLGTLTFASTTLAATSAGARVFVEISGGKYYLGTVVDDGASVGIIIDGSMTVLPASANRAAIEPSEHQSYPASGAFSRIGIAGDGSMYLGAAGAPDYHVTSPTALSSLSIGASSFVQIDSTTFSASALQTTGTVATTINVATVTGTGTAFSPAWRNGKITIGVNTYTITAVGSATSLTISPAAAATTTLQAFYVQTMDSKWKVGTL